MFRQREPLVKGLIGFSIGTALLASAWAQKSGQAAGPYLPSSGPSTLASILPSSIPSALASILPLASPSATASASASPAAALANCYAAIAAQPQFSNYITAINQAGLQSSLQGTGPFTVFVPTNNAFASVNSIDDDALPELYASNNSNNNGATLVQVLQYGVVPGQYSSAQLAGLSTVNTLEGAGLQLSGGQLINGSNEVPNANIVAADIQANNCTIQGVDQIVFPPGYNL